MNFSNIKESISRFISKSNPSLKDINGKVGIKESGIGLVSSIESFNDNIDEVENDFEVIEEAIKIYDNFPIAQEAVDSQAEQTVTEFHFIGDNKESLKEFSDEFNLPLVLFNIAKIMQKTGICFVEAPKDPFNEFKIKELKVFEETQYFKIFRFKTGKIIGISQEVYGKDVLWGATGKKDKTSSYKKRRKLDEIFFFKVGPGKYGKPLVYSSRHLFKSKDKIEAEFHPLIQRYSTPIIHAQVGDEMNPPSSDDVNDVAGMLEDIYADTEYATSYLVKLNTLEFKGKGIEVEPISKYVDSQIMKGLRQPDLNDTDGKIAEVKLKFSNRHILALQRELKTQFEDKVIIGLGIGNKTDKIIFDNPDERDKEAYFDRIINLVNAGIITPQKGNDLLPDSFKETLPEPIEQEVGDDGKTKVNRLDNPTDPTQSTKSEKGRRIKRTDKKASIDDSGENNKSRDK